MKPTSFPRSPTAASFAVRALILACMLGVETAPRAQPAPKLLPFQGHLTDSSGNPVADGAKIVLFRIYDAPVAGSVAWPGEVHRTTVNSGLVSVILGSKGSLQQVDFGRPLYLEITVDANGDDAITAADPPLLPRQVLLPVVFAKESGIARTVVDAAITADKIAAAAVEDRHIARVSRLTARDGDPAAAVVVDDLGNVGVGTAVPGSRLDIQGDKLLVSDRVDNVQDHKAFVEGGSTGWAYFGAYGRQPASFGNRDDYQTLTVDDGRVGIGTVSPSAKLSVRGDGYTSLIGIGGAEADNVGYLSLYSNSSPHQRLIVGGKEGIEFRTGPHASSSERLRVTDAGNVGIGTSSPQATLDVSGRVKATAFAGDGSALTGVLPADGSVTLSKLSPYLRLTLPKTRVSNYVKANDSNGNWIMVFSVNTPGMLTGMSLKSQLYNPGGDSHAEFTLRITLDGTSWLIPGLNIPRGNRVDYRIVAATWSATDPPSLSAPFVKAAGLGTAFDLNVGFTSSCVIELRSDGYTDGRNGFYVATAYRN